VLGFITAQRTGRADDRVLQPVLRAEEGGGLATSTVARRLSIGMRDGYAALAHAL
jgi:hypothetical protein